LPFHPISSGSPGKIPLFTYIGRTNFRNDLRLRANQIPVPSVTPPQISKVCGIPIPLATDPASNLFYPIELDEYFEKELMSGRS
jgi:hypothetical protein